MRGRSPYQRGLWFLAVVAGVAAGPSARGDGGFFLSRETPRKAVSSPTQFAVIVRDGPAHECLLLQTGYRGPASEFAWVVPVPGLPGRGDLFVANPKLLEELERATRPLLFTLQADSPNSWRDVLWSYMLGLGPLMLKGTLGAPPGERARPPAIRLHQRLDVGDYDAAVLSADRAGALVAWLRENGFAIPASAGPVLGGYVRKHWSFVAIRVRPQSRQAHPLAADLPPFGIRFPTRDLVYPLAVSRVSAGKRSTLLLIALDASPVRCRELRCVRIGGGTAPTLRALERRALADTGGSALVCEGDVRIDRYSDLPTALRGAASLSRDGALRRRLDGMVATRLWGEMPAAAMVDLAFHRTDETPERLSLTRSGTVPAPPAASRPAYLAYSGLLALLLVAAVWPRRCGAPDAQAAPGGSRLGRVLRHVAWFVFILIALAPARLILGHGVVLRTDLPPGVVVLLLLLACVPMADWAVEWAMEHPRGARWSISLSGTILVFPWLALTAGEVADGVLHDIGWPAQVAARQDAAIAVIGSALVRFHDATGAYPRALDELTRPAPPATGVDAAGNEVPIAGELSMPLLEALPADPMNGRSDAWVYDVTSPTLVESGAYSVRSSGWLGDTP